MTILMDQLEKIREIIVGYVKPAHNGGTCYLTENPDHRDFVVIDIYKFQGKRHADASLIVRIEPDYLIIERDMNNKPLVDALVQAGIPRDKIILAYAGEPVPETA